MSRGGMHSCQYQSTTCARRDVTLSERGKIEGRGKIEERGKIEGDAGREQQCECRGADESIWVDEFDEAADETGAVRARTSGAAYSGVPCNPPTEASSLPASPTAQLRSAMSTSHAPSGFSWRTYAEGEAPMGGMTIGGHTSRACSSLSLHVN